MFLSAQRDGSGQRSAAVFISDVDVELIVASFQAKHVALRMSRTPAYRDFGSSCDIGDNDDDIVVVVVEGDDDAIYYVAVVLL